MLHTVDAQALGPTVQNVVTTATWRPALVHTCAILYGFVQLVAWAFFGVLHNVAHQTVHDDVFSPQIMNLYGMRLSAHPDSSYVMKCD
jgi:hypothetical protein